MFLVAKLQLFCDLLFNRPHLFNNIKAKAGQDASFSHPSPLICSYRCRFSKRRVDLVRCFYTFHPHLLDVATDGDVLCGVALPDALLRVGAVDDILVADNHHLGQQTTRSNNSPSVGTSPPIAVIYPFSKLTLVGAVNFSPSNTRTFLIVVAIIVIVLNNLLQNYNDFAKNPLSDKK